MLRTSGHAARRMRTAAATLPVAVALLLLLLLAPTASARAEAPCPHAKTQHARVSCLVKAVRWERKNVRQAHMTLARVRAANPLMDTTYICKLGEVIYHVRTSHCTSVVGCESGGRPNLNEYGGSNGARGASQYQPRTWAGALFGRAGFSIYDPVAQILSMDAYAAVHGFNTGGGWAASHGCHGLSGPEA